MQLYRRELIRSLVILSIRPKYGGFIGPYNRHLQNDARNRFQSAQARCHSPVGPKTGKADRRKSHAFQHKDVTHRFGALRHGGGGTPTTIVCGFLSFDRASLKPISRLLPSFILIKTDQACTLALHITMHCVTDYTVFGPGLHTSEDSRWGGGREAIPRPASGQERREPPLGADREPLGSSDSHGGSPCTITYFKKAAEDELPGLFAIRSVSFNSTGKGQTGHSTCPICSSSQCVSGEVSPSNLSSKSAST